ncbi:DUF2505 domain-containing protein [Demequina activiva]|uniref:DUF2505 domain-containing protein n=1 Tax=Demequina activiva TaxID=1582364 RepID=A0A919Q7U4_9MICO|nr:DUF2505 domain-containing protein [Demequina activiva]GIG55370.1 hypothetical protein Dac01nite_21220 [Demequina activiva]
MRITHEHVFDAAPDAVCAMLANREFASARGAASGARHPEVDVEGTADEGFTVAIRQGMPASTIPAEFRSFVGSEITVRYTEVWEPPQGEDRHGTFAVEIVGAPGHAAGSLSLVPEGAGSRFLVDGSVTVKVPLFGAMIEKAVGESVLKGLRAELAAADEWLAREA